MIVTRNFYMPEKIKDFYALDIQRKKRKFIFKITSYELLIYELLIYEPA